MLRSLRRWWEGYIAGIPKTEVVDSVPESQWDRADLQPRVSKARRQAFVELLALVHSHLPPDVAAPRVERGAAALVRSDEIDLALREALLPEEPLDEPGPPGFIGCDWKAIDDVQWQADRLCQAHGIGARWSAPSGDLVSMLRDLDAWLQARGRGLLCFWTGDSVVAFAVQAGQIERAVALGKKLKVPIGRPGED